MIHICTLYNDHPSPEMLFTRDKLTEKLGHIKTHWIKCGVFRKGVANVHISDTEEVFHRNRYLNCIPPESWFLVLDSDELIIGALDLIPGFLEDLDSKNILTAGILEMRPDLKIIFRPRLIKKKAGMQYVKKHDCIMYKDQNILSSVQAVISAFGFFHYKSEGKFTVDAVMPKILREQFNLELQT